MSLWFDRSRHLPSDLVLFTLLIGGYAIALAFRFDLPAALGMMLIVLVAVGIYVRTTSSRIRWVMVCLVIAAIAIAPTILAIYLRRVNAPYEFIHDSALQIESAIQFLLAGKNPYAVNYFGTPLEQWWIPPPGESVNPALYYFVYFPFVFLGLVPFYLLAQATLGWFDVRLIFLPLFIATLGLLPRLTHSPERQRALVLAIGLNPLLVPFLVEGRNDVFVFFWIVASLVALRYDHPIISALAFALACASKLTAFFLLPFLIIYFGFANVSKIDWGVVAHGFRRIALPAFVFAIVFSAIMLPFVLADFTAFFQDTFRYPAGLTEHRYPMKNIGLGGIALALNWAEADAARLPFGLMQIIFGIPALVALSIQQFRHNSLARAMWHGAILFLVIGFFSYMFNENHLGFGLLLGIVGAFMETALWSPSKVGSIANFH